MMARLATAPDTTAIDPTMTDDLQRKIDDAEVEGWALESEQNDRAVMTKRSYGSLGAHLLIALLTVWWTLGLGNVAYASYVYFSKADKKVLRAGE